MEGDLADRAIHVIGFTKEIKDHGTEAIIEG